MITVYNHDIMKTLLDTINTIPESEYEKYFSDIYLNDDVTDEYDEQASALLVTFKNIIKIKFLMTHTIFYSDYTVYEVTVVPNMQLSNIYGFRYDETHEDVIKVANEILKKIIDYASTTMNDTVTHAIQEVQMDFAV